MTAQLLRQNQFNLTAKQEKLPESLSKREQWVQKSVDEIMLRVRRAEGRLQTIESELQVLDERMKAASDILGSPKKKKRSSTGSVVSGPGSKRKMNRGSRKISPIKLPKIKESDEVKKLINLNANYRRDGPGWKNLAASDLINLSKAIKAQTTSVTGKMMRSSVAQTGPNKIRASSKVNDAASSSKTDKKLKSLNTIKKATKPASKTTSISKSSPSEFIDPKTGRRIVNPVRNMWCMHVYEKSTIKKLIEGRNDVLCPHPDCTNKMAVNILDLVPVEKRSVKTSALQSKRNVHRNIPIRA